MQIPWRRAVTLPVAMLFALWMSGCSGSGSEGDATSEPPATNPGVSEVSEESQGPSRLSYPLEELPEGRSRTGLGSELPVTFDVSEGWWGEQSSGNAWVIGKGPAARPARPEVILWVEELAYPFHEALAIFKKVDRIVPGAPTPLRVDGRPASMFDAAVQGKEHVPLVDLGTGGDVRWDLDCRQVFIDLDGTTMLVRIELRGGHLGEALRVLRSFRIGR